jgi:hypothetical protein
VTAAQATAFPRTCRGIDRRLTSAHLTAAEAVREVTPSARRAAAAIATEKADSHPLAELPGRHPLAEGVDLADDFMARYAGVVDVGSETLDGESVRMTDAARFDTDPDLPRRGRREFLLHHFQAAGLAYLNGAIGLCHGQLLRVEKSLPP